MILKNAVKSLPWKRSNISMPNFRVNSMWRNLHTCNRNNYPDWTKTILTHFMSWSNDKHQTDSCLLAKREQTRKSSAEKPNHQYVQDEQRPGRETTDWAVTSCFEQIGPDFLSSFVFCGNKLKLTATKTGRERHRRGLSFVNKGVVVNKCTKQCYRHKQKCHDSSKKEVALPGRWRVMIHELVHLLCYWMMCRRR